MPAITLRLTEEQYLAIERAAKEQHRSLSRQISYWMETGRKADQKEEVK